jgi:hypothetical protein
MKSTLIMGCLATLLLAACSSEKSAVQNAIDKDLSTHPVCVHFGDNKVTFPWQFGGDLHSNSILVVLEKEGLIHMTVKDQPFAVPTAAVSTYYGKLTTLDITPKGHEKNVWDPEKGFCIGNRKVASVEKWTAPTASDGVQTTVVDYTWRVDDLPFGIDRSDFPDLPGMGKPKSAHAELRKMNEGWDVMQNDAY